MAKPPLESPDEIRAALTALFAKARRSWSKRGIARELGAMLAPCIEALERMIDEGRAAEAEPLLKRIVKSAEPTLDIVDDSHARFHPLCSRALVLWGRAWARIEPRKPAKIAAMVRTFAGDGGHATRDHIILAFADALGTEGLHALREMYSKELEALRDVDPHELRDFSRDAISLETRRWSIFAALREVADALGDVDEYIALCTRGGRADRYGVEIATRLVAKGRHSEALEWLDRTDADDRAAAARRGLPDLDSDGPARPGALVRSMALRGLGRHEHAEDALWREFERFPCMKTLDDVVAMLGAERAHEACQRAVELAMRHHDVHDVLDFLRDAARWDEAATVLLTRSGELDGHYYGILTRLAKRLEATHPSASWHAYRALMDAILADGRRPAYEHAAHYLLRMRALAAPAQLEAEQQQVETHLLSKHRLKRSFWESVEDGE